MDLASDLRGKHMSSCIRMDTKSCMWLAVCLVGKGTTFFIPFHRDLPFCVPEVIDRQREAWAGCCQANECGALSVAVASGNRRPPMPKTQLVLAFGPPGCGPSPKAKLLTSPCLCPPCSVPPSAQTAILEPCLGPRQVTGSCLLPEGSGEDTQGPGV